MTSQIYKDSKPRTKNRRLCRQLNDEAVARAIIKSRDPKHNWKFLSPSQKFILGVRHMLSTSYVE